MSSTIRDIAKLANTSKSTVSRYLNGQAVKKKTQEAIEKVIKDLNYHRNIHARRLVMSKTLTIGVVVEEITNVFNTNILRGIEQIAKEKKFNCVFYSWSSNSNHEEGFLDLLHEGQVDGLILISFKKRDKPLLNMIAESDYPIVLIGDSQLTESVCAIDIDNSFGISEAVRHLHENNHREIAYISGPKGAAATETRLQSYKSTMAQLGLKIRPEFIVDSNWTNETGHTAMQKLLSIGGFTAVAASNDETAIGAIKAVQEMGLQTPVDIAVTGFDDIPVAKWVYPSLTTIRQPFAEMGVVAAKELFKRIEKQDSADPMKHLLKPELVVRRSTIC
ncbi:LacI family transcriptional regulator [Scopulibacillus darangshiensis]|uniref:LacI family transcriptional regulator n=2 Tax=Scopulibacillus darangshiensis TaxID=442528 RepID=A0A4R2P3V0_9BACL|nr:LacI family transcriptional regulator [Scopulibacillus darangshiensis]